MASWPATRIRISRLPCGTVEPRHWELYILKFIWVIFTNKDPCPEKKNNTLMIKLLKKSLLLLIHASTPDPLRIHATNGGFEYKGWIRSPDESSELPWPGLAPMRESLPWSHYGLVYLEWRELSREPGPALARLVASSPLWRGMDLSASEINYSFFHSPWV